MTEGRTQTFLFADLAGFTALTEAHGDQEAAELASDFFDQVRQLLPDYRGEEIKTIGDACGVRKFDRAANRSASRADRVCAPHRPGLDEHAPAGTTR
jgi:class 3 adenylate cyclase